jgi:hypothetical protein
MIDVPYFGELAAKNVFEDVKSNIAFAQYLPDLDLLKRPPNRQYLFNVSRSLSVLWAPRLVISQS